MEFTAVVLPVVDTAAAETTDDVRGEAAALAVVLPVAAATTVAATTVAAANLATALVVSAAAAAANVSEVTTDTTQVQKDLGGEESIVAQHFETVQQQQCQHHSACSQGVLESVMARTTIGSDKATCIDLLDNLITELSTLSDRSAGVSPGFDCIDTDLPWKQIGSFPQYETLDSVNATRGDIPLPSPESALELFKQIKSAWQKRLDYETCDTEEERESYCSCIGRWRPNQNAMKHLCNQVLEQVMAREASNCLRTQPAITRLWNEAFSNDTCPHPDTMDCLYIDSSIRLLTTDTYLNAYIQAALATTSTSE